MQAGPHDLGKIDSVAVESTKMMVVRNHHIAAVAEKIDHASIFRSRKMMGLKIHGGLMTPIITAGMNVRHQIENLRIGERFRIETVNDAGDQILHPGVSAFWIAGDKNVRRISLLDGSESGRASDFFVESILKKSCRHSEDRLDDFRNRSFHGILD